MVTAFLDKGFHEQRTVAVAVLEVVGQAAQGQAEGLRGQVAAVDGRANQETAQSDHPVQLAGALVGVPADEGVASGQRESRYGEAEGSQHAVVGDQQVGQLGTDVLDGATRVLAAHQLVPDPALGRVGDLDKFQSVQLASCGRPRASRKPNRTQRSIESALEDTVDRQVSVLKWSWLLPLAAGIGLFLLISIESWGLAQWQSSRIRARSQTLERLDLEIGERTRVLEQLDEATWGIRLHEETSGKYIVLPKGAIPLDGRDQPQKLDWTVGGLAAIKLSLP